LLHDGRYFIFVLRSKLPYYYLRTIKDRHMSGFEMLLKSVINTGLCTACGTCVAVCPKGIISFDQESERPVTSFLCKSSCYLCFRVCPGKNIPMIDLEKFVFGRERDLRDLKEFKLGISRRFLKGYATDLKIRKNGTSGGVVTALLVYGKEMGLIDGAVVASMDETQPWKTVPKFATETEEIRKAAKSKYVIVPNNACLRETQKKEVNKIALVGCPCHIHGLRKIQFLGQPKNISQKVDIAIGLYCGMNYPFDATRHLLFKLFGFKSLHQIKKIEYRGGPSNQDFLVERKDGKIFSIPTERCRNIFMHMRRERCSMCFDWAADLADLSIGDIFYQGTVKRVPYWSNITIRTRKGLEWIRKAEETGYIKTSPFDPASIYKNYLLGNKKYGAVYNVSERRKLGWPVPNYQFLLKEGTV
jgi:coenzyme F420 hydrogenase subunit beta